MIESLWKEEG